MWYSFACLDKDFEMIQVPHAAAVDRVVVVALVEAVEVDAAVRGWTKL